MGFILKILAKIGIKEGKKELARKIGKFFTDTAISKIKNIGAKLKTSFKLDTLPKISFDDIKPKFKIDASKLISSGQVTSGARDEEDDDESKDDEYEKEFDNEQEDESEDISPVIVTSVAVLGSTIASVAVAKGVGFTMPDIDFDIPKKGGDFKFDFSLRDINIPTPTFGQPEGFVQGKKINVQNTAGEFEYKRTAMPSAVYGNPLNIRPVQYKDKSGKTRLRTDKWEGLTGMHYIKGAGYFLAFEDPYYSFRAAARNLMSYQKDGLYSVHDWLYRYCPTKDEYAGAQATQSYVNDVVKRANATGLVSINEYSKIDITNKNVYIAILKGMAWHESNLNVSIDYLSRCYDAQFFGAPKPLQNEMIAKNSNRSSFFYQTSQYSSDIRKQKTEHKMVKNNA